MNEEGLMKSAILLMSIGEEEASEVMKFLSPKEVQKLGQTMAGLKSVTREKIDSVLTTFETESQEQTSIGMDTDVYLRSVLNKALGEEKAGFILDRILQGGDTSGIESLKWMDAPSVAELIKNEHPQIIASVLVHLERDQASEVLTQLPERVRNDALLRIATLDGIQPAALRELNDVLAKSLAGKDTLKKAALGGAGPAAEILNFMGTAHESSVIESVREYDPDLAQAIIDKMFVFDNIIDIDDRGIQTVLREVQSESLIVALKGASEELREKIFKNMSQRAAETLREELESKGPVRLSEVENEQKEILKIVRRLTDEGQIAVAGKGEEAYV
jgi:flagellar motor switch protein FliG